MSRYKWVNCPKDTVIERTWPDGRPWKQTVSALYSVGINDDGTLWNPNNYPEDLVRKAVLEADERRKVKRSNAAKKAAETRAKRKERLVYDVARTLGDGGNCGPRDNCILCGKGLDDPTSIKRGIGPECWQTILRAIAEKTGGIGTQCPAE